MKMMCFSHLGVESYWRPYSFESVIRNMLAYWKKTIFPTKLLNLLNENEDDSAKNINEYIHDFDLLQETSLWQNRTEL